MDANELSSYLSTVAKADESKNDYAYTPSDSPSDWKLNISDAKHVAGALAALGSGGFRGQKVSIPEADLPAVKRKVLAAWKKFHPDEKEVPNILKGDHVMTNEEMAAELAQLKGNLDETSKRADRFEAIAKLSADERAVFEKLDAAKQEEFLKGDAAVRKTLSPVDKGIPSGFMAMTAAEQKAAMADMSPADKKKAQDMIDADAEEDASDTSKKLEVMKRDFESKLAEIKKDSDARIATAENLAKAERDAREKTEFAKRAEKELGNYSGKAEEKGEVLRALHNAVHKTMTPEQLKGVTDLLAAGNEAIGKLTAPLGRDYSGEGSGSAEQRMESLVTKRMAENKDLSKGQAWLEVAREHPELYNDISNKHA